MTQSSPPSSPTGEDRIVDVDLTDEMADSFLEYAYSVIYQRALPDARDGLKPVQRRILYQMAQMGLTPDRGHVKSARVVGEVMGKLHPHGDAAIYDALVRLSQDFSLRVPLIDGHGNFGSLDDGPAAARYTEARLRPEAMVMVGEIDEDVVDFVPNYDNQLSQPSVLPAGFPCLLVNGASGIAVGMATNMPPHNLGEVIDAAITLIENPEASLDELMVALPGPDLPGGGIIVGRDGVREAYETGRGSFRTRARAAIESVGPRSTGLVVTELPYLVGPERVIERIKDGVLSKKIQGISDVNDLTDRTRGLRLVITVKSGFDPQLVLDQLYRLTPLEENFAINNVALVDGQPRTLGLRELLQVFIDHRIEVTTRRSAFRLRKAEDRLHLVDGLLLAIADIDEVIQVIRGSDDSAQARETLCTVFDLSTTQAEYILELRLRRLTKFSRIELESERDELRKNIDALTALLADHESVRALVASELREVAHRFANPRRTELVDAEGAPVRASSSAAQSASLELSDRPCLVVLSASGRVARVDTDQGLSMPTGRFAHDALVNAVHSSTRSQLGALSSDGILYRFTAGDLPAGADLAAGLSSTPALRDFLGLAPLEKVVSIVAVGEGAGVLAIGTRDGVVKRIDLAGVPDRPQVSVIGVKPGDAVVGAGISSDDDWLVFITDDAQLLRFQARAVRPQGAPAGGMAGIALNDGARVLSFDVAADLSSNVCTVSSSLEALAEVAPQRAKVTELSQFPDKGRATRGVRAHTLLKGEDCLVIARCALAPLAIIANGKAGELPTTMAKRDASGTLLASSVAHIGRSADSLVS